MTNKERIEKAKSLGKQAFIDGLNSAPHGHPTLFKLIPNGWENIKLRIKIYKAYSFGWTIESLK